MLPEPTTPIFQDDAGAQAYADLCAARGLQTVIQKYESDWKTGGVSYCDGSHAPDQRYSDQLYTSIDLNCVELDIGMGMGDTIAEAGGVIGTIGWTEYAGFFWFDGESDVHPNQPFHHATPVGWRGDPKFPVCIRVNRNTEPDRSVSGLYARTCL
jgi:hypothetical protein